MNETINVYLENGLKVSLRTDMRVMSLGNNEILIVTGEHRGLKGKLDIPGCKTNALTAKETKKLNIYLRDMFAKLKRGVSRLA